MEPIKLYFDFRDIFRAPRLALSGKKSGYSSWETLLVFFFIGYFPIRH